MKLETTGLATVLLGGVSLVTIACGTPSHDERPAPAVIAPNPDVQTEAAPELDFRKVILEDARLPTVKNVSATISRAQALEDVEFLEFFLEFGYGANAYLESRAHVDVRGALATIKEHVRSREEWSVADIFGELRPLVENVLQDGHMALYVPTEPVSARWATSGAHHWDAYVFSDAEQASEIVSTCTFPPATKVLVDQQYLQVEGAKTIREPIILSRDPLISVTCGGDPTPHALRKLSPSNHQLSRAFGERELDSATYYIRLPSFATTDATTRDAFISSGTKARGYETVVLDLRGNPGGDPAYFLAWLEELGVKGTIKMAPLVHTESFAADVLLNNALEDAIHDERIDAVAKRELAAKLKPRKAALHRDLDANDFRRFVPANIDAADEEYTLSPASEPFAGVVRVLVDDRCASACEWAAHGSKQLPGFMVMSETNTAGIIRGADPSPLVLPNSSIVVTIPIGLGAQPGTQIVEGQGVAPEVWVQPEAMRVLFP